MNKQAIITAVRRLNLPQGSYVVFGSCPMAAVGIREASDIDLFVTPEAIAELKKRGWKQIEKSPDDKPYVEGDFEAHDTWSFTSYKPTFEHILQTADMYDGIPFASLDEVRMWKVASGRPKDIRDLELLDAYLAERSKTGA